MKRDGKTGKVGIVLGLLFALCDVIASFFSSGCLYKLFTSHNAARERFDSSATVTIYRKVSKHSRKFSGGFRKWLSRQFERSIVLTAFSSLTKKMLSLPGRVIGSFTITWSAYVLLISFVKMFVLVDSTASLANIICGAVVFLASIPLMLADKSIITLCAESPLVYRILNGVFGVPAESLKKSNALYVGQSGAVILGIVLGLLTYVISPVYMVLSIFAVITFALIMTYPEGGVVISIAVAPLLGIIPAPSITLAAIVLLTAFAYFIKVVRGKRVFKFGITEFAFWGFALVMLLGGFAPGEANTFENALLSVALMLIFPMTVNLMKYKRWIKNCVLAFIIPASIVAFIGIVQYSLGMAPSGWIDQTLFGGITSRAVSIFNNPNILGLYLSVSFPMLLLSFYHKSPKIKLLGGIASAFVIVCVAFTYSRSAWIALLCGGIAFAVMASPRGILWLIPSAGVGALAYIAFPDSIGARLANFATLADSANSYRMAVWNSSWNMLPELLLGGVGLGEEAFKTAYINYAAAGTQSVMHSHNLYMQIVIQLGLIGLLLFLLVLFVVCRKCFSAPVTSSGKDITLTSRAALAGAVALLAAGLFDYTWYNFRVFFIFWALIGVACAATGLYENENREDIIPDYDENSYSLTVRIPKTKDRYEGEREDAQNE